MSDKRIAKPLTRTLVIATVAVMGALGLVKQEALGAQAPQLTDGFGNGATGGMGGQEYFVTSLANSGPGTLRAGAQSTIPRQIRFRVSGTIALTKPILVGSNKTIDGEGANVTITTKGLLITNSRNIIIRNLTFARGEGIDTDAIQIAAGADTVLVDHCEFSDWMDGLVDITQGATNVTVSWSYFHDQEKVMLVDPFARKGLVQVTVHHNRFEGTDARSPKLRTSHVHAYNNYLTGWTGYGMEVGSNGELYSQANVFEAANNKQAIRIQGVENVSVKSDADLLLNGALVQERNRHRVFNPGAYYVWTVDAPDSNLITKILASAGVSKG